MNRLVRSWQGEPPRRQLAFSERKYKDFSEMLAGELCIPKICGIVGWHR